MTQQEDIDEIVTNEVRRRAAEEEVDRRLTMIDEYGKDEYPDGTAIKFKKRFNEVGPDYTYLAIKLAGKWYTTGKLGFNGVDWPSLVTWLVTGKVATPASSLVFLVEDHPEAPGKWLTTNELSSMLETAREEGRQYGFEQASESEMKSKYSHRIETEDAPGSFHGDPPF